LISEKIKKMKNKIKTTIATGLAALVGFMPIVTGAEETNETVMGPINVQESVVCGTEQDQVRSETTISGKDYQAVIDFEGQDYLLGADLKLNSSRINAGIKEIGNVQSTRLNLEVKQGNYLLGAGIQTKGTEDMQKAYIKRKSGETELGLAATTDNRFTGTIRKGLNEKNGVMAATTLSDEDYYRAGIGLGHSGKIGFLAYAIIGENNDGSKHQDFRIRGGLGNKQKKGSEYFFGLNDTCMFEESLMFDPTCRIFSGPFENFNASLRGDPIGFDARYKNGAASLELAGRIGPVILLPQAQYDTNARKWAGRTGVQIDLGKKFSVRTQANFSENSKPSYDGMITYSLDL
jgi:hypothetical protein